MISQIRALLLSIAVLIVGFGTANAERLLIGVSVDVVPVQSDFNGTEIVVFGAIDSAFIDQMTDNRYDVVIAVEGPKEDIVVRKKDRILGVWANNASQGFQQVPSFYTVISDRPIAEIGDEKLLQENSVGIDNIPMVEMGGAVSVAGDQYADSLRRIRRNNTLFSEKSRLEFLSPALFRAYVELPANVPIGEHTVKAYLFKKGELINSTESKFSVAKAGFERLIYETAHENSLIYGILAVILAIFTGWTANVVFRKD